MKHLTCKNLGMESCSFESHGETSEEVKNNMLDHAKESHPEIFENMSDEKMADMDSMMENAIEER